MFRKLVTAFVLLSVVAATEHSWKDCIEGDYQCAVGNCIPMRWACDGFLDCLGGDDEDGCTSCREHYVQCPSSTYCIEDYKICDGVGDCPDDRDEPIDCGTPPPECDEDEFTCGDGSCINNAFRCDGLGDCDDDTDEINCESCQTGFHCEENTCIPGLFLCDDYEDCMHGEDETTGCDCDITDFICENGHCIPQGWHCDGDVDCYGGDDEADCPVNGTLSSQHVSKTSKNQTNKLLLSKIKRQHHGL